MKSEFQLIQPEEVSKEFLKTILDEACLESYFDSDGDIVVRDDITVYVIPDKKNNNRIRFISSFGFNTQIE